MTEVAKSTVQLNLTKILEVQVQRSEPCFFGGRNRPYRLCLLPRQTYHLSFSECFAFRDRLLEAFMATRTREQLAIVLDSARCWTAVPMMSTGCYDTNHLFYAFHGVYSVYTPGRHRITITYYNIMVQPGYIHYQQCL